MMSSESSENEFVFQKFKQFEIDDYPVSAIAKIEIESKDKDQLRKLFLSKVNEPQFYKGHRIQINWISHKNSLITRSSYNDICKYQAMKQYVDQFNREYEHLGSVNVLVLKYLNCFYD